MKNYFNNVPAQGKSSKELNGHQIFKMIKKNAMANPVPATISEADGDPDESEKLSNQAPTKSDIFKINMVNNTEMHALKKNDSRVSKVSDSSKNEKTR